jgi:hypothetical protein
VSDWLNEEERAEVKAILAEHKLAREVEEAQVRADRERLKQGLPASRALYYGNTPNIYTTEWGIKVLSEREP